MASQALQDLIAAKRANPYSADKTLAELRAEADSRAATPLPDGTAHVVADASGVPGEWVDAPGVATDRVFLFLHGRRLLSRFVGRLAGNLGADCGGLQGPGVLGRLPAGARTSVSGRGR